MSTALPTRTRAWKSLAALLSGEAVTAAFLVLPQIKAPVRPRRSFPGEVLGHGPLLHGLDVLGAVEPGRDGPADGVGQRLGVEVGEHEAGAAGGRLVVVLDGVDQAPGRPDDGQRPVAEAVHLVQAAGLEA